MLLLITVAIVCTVSGRYIADTYRKRVLLLEKAEVMISVIRDEIRFYALPINELLDLLSEKDALKQLKFISRCKSLIFGGYEFPEAWRKALKNKDCTAHLKGKDIDLLLDFGEHLGITDTTGQLSNCEIYLEFIRFNLNEAKKEREQYSGIITVLGFLSGIALIIVLI